MNLKVLGMLLLILAAGVAHAALPKEVVLDKYIRSAASYYKNQQYRQCLDELDEAEKFANGKLKIPDDLIFIRAKSNLELGLLGQAKKHATRYIETAGTKGRYYDQALELVIDAEHRQQAPGYLDALRSQAFDKQWGKEKDIKTSFNLYLEAAEFGDVKSMNVVVSMLLNGEGVAANKQQAIAWLEKAASLGDIHAQARLAAFYSDSGDKVRAFVTYLKVAAHKNDANLDESEARTVSTAEQIITQLYFYGEGVAPDKAKAIERLTSAARTNSDMGFSATTLGHIYATGSLDGNQSGAQAMNWYYSLDGGARDGTNCVRSCIATAYCLESGHCGVPADVAEARRRYQHHLDSNVFYAGGRQANAGLGRIAMQKGDWRDAEAHLRCAAYKLANTITDERFCNKAEVLAADKVDGDISQPDFHAGFWLALLLTVSGDPAQHNAVAAREALGKLPKGSGWVSDWFEAMLWAAIYANEGDFALAVAEQQKAIQLASAKNDKGPSENFKLMWRREINIQFLLSQNRKERKNNLYGYNADTVWSVMEYWRQFLPAQLASYQQKQVWSYAAPRE